MRNEDQKINTETESSEVLTKDLLADNEMTARRLVWLAHQPQKVSEICEHWFNWQWDELSDDELITKIGEILFSDYPVKVTHIPANVKAHESSEQ